MSITQHLVSPKLPTALADDTCVDLPGYDIWVIYEESVYIVPTKLDVSKFTDALSRVLQLYPHAAGQLRCNDGCWSIELTNTPVPVAVEHRLDMSAESFLNGNWVMQDDVSPLLNQHPRGANLINGDAPLFRAKLTLFENETCIGISVNHSLGDGFAILRLLHTLSQFYQGLPSEFAPPTFKKYHFPTPSESMMAEFAARVPFQSPRPFDAAALAEVLNPERVRWRFDVHDLEKLRSALSARQKTRLSKQDCLTAYIVAVLNSARDSPLRSANIVTSYRHVQAPFIIESVAGNQFLVLPGIIPTDLGGIASAVRNALVQFREPHFIHLLESVRSARTLESMNAGKAVPSLPHVDDLIVNSQVAIDWRSAHFGFPDGTRFHTHGFFGRMMKCFSANPTKGPEDGVWISNPSIEVSMGVTGGLKSKVMETLGRGVQYILDQDIDPSAQGIVVD